MGEQDQEVRKLELQSGDHRYMSSSNHLVAVVSLYSEDGKIVKYIVVALLLKVVTWIDFHRLIGYQGTKWPYNSTLQV